MRIVRAALIAVVALDPGCDAGPGGAIGETAVQAPAPAGVLDHAAVPCAPRSPLAYEPDAITRERDMLLILLAYAIAYDDWQDAGAVPRRGHNIAAVLADPDGKPVCWARNSVIAADDATQHAEVRLLTSYLRTSRGTHANRLTLYSTLEPCAMCAGMTLMTGLHAVLYGEHAFPSGSVYERLARDTRDEGGFCPYPYSVIASAAPTDFVARLDDARVRVNDGRVWMDSAVRRAIHAEAAHTLEVYEARHRENAEVLTMVRRFRVRVPRTVPSAPYRIGCPSFEASSEVP